MSIDQTEPSLAQRLAAVMISSGATGDVARDVVLQVGARAADTSPEAAGAPEVDPASEMPEWARIYQEWFPLRSECRTYAGAALEHFKILILEEKWPGDASMSAIGTALGVELSCSAALKDFGEQTARPAPPEGAAANLEKAAGDYLNAVAALAAAIRAAAESATKHLQDKVAKMQRDNVGAFHPELADALVASKTCIFFITQILAALGPATMGVSAAVAPLVALAATAIEKGIIEANVKTDLATVKSLVGKKIGSDTEWVEHGEKIHERLDDVHGHAEKVVKAVQAFGDVPGASEALKLGTEVAEGALSGIGVALSAAGLYLDMQKYDTTRKVVDAVPPEVMIKLQKAAEEVFTLHSRVITAAPVAVLEGRLTPEGQLRDFATDAVQPFAAVPTPAPQGKGSSDYPDWEAACKVAALLNAKGEAWYDDVRHPFWAITTVKDEAVADTGQTVIEHLHGQVEPGGYPVAAEGDAPP